MHHTVVVNVHGFHLAGNVRGQRHHVGADLAVARLRGVGVIEIKLPQHACRDQNGNQGQRGAQQSKGTFTKHGVLRGGKPFQAVEKQPGQNKKQGGVEQRSCATQR